MARRIFTIVGRNGTVLITDSKENANGNGALYEYHDEKGNTQLCAIKALNERLSTIPRPNQVKFDKPVAFLLPRFLEFLKYEDTRNVWISTGFKKNGEAVDPELLEEIKIMDKHVKELKNNVNLFGHYRLILQEFIDYKNATWKLLDEKVPVTAVEKVDASQMDFN